MFTDGLRESCIICLKVVSRTALRTVSFGHSECSRVKAKSCCFVFFCLLNKKPMNKVVWIYVVLRCNGYIILSVVYLNSCFAL